MPIEFTECKGFTHKGFGAAAPVLREGKQVVAVGYGVVILLLVGKREKDWRKLRHT